MIFALSKVFFPFLRCKEGNFYTRLCKIELTGTVLYKHPFRVDLFSLSMPSYILKCKYEFLFPRAHGIINYHLAFHEGIFMKVFSCLSD